MKKTIPLVAAICMTSAAAVHAQTTAPATPPLNSTQSPSTSPPPPANMPPSATMPSANTATVTPGSSVTLTDDEARTWIDKVIYSSDGSNLGEVAAFARDSSGKVTEMHGDVGGLMGVGETRVRIMPSQFKLEGDRVTLNLTKEQAKGLPQVAKTN